MPRRLGVQSGTQAIEPDIELRLGGRPHRRAHHFRDGLCGPAPSPLVGRFHRRLTVDSGSPPWAATSSTVMASRCPSVNTKRYHGGSGATTSDTGLCVWGVGMVRRSPVGTAVAPNHENRLTLFEGLETSAAEMTRAAAWPGAGPPDHNHARQKLSMARP